MDYLKPTSLTIRNPVDDAITLAATYVYSVELLRAISWAVESALPFPVVAHHGQLHHVLLRDLRIMTTRSITIEGWLML
jgi:hypothetical protein